MSQSVSQSVGRSKGEWVGEQLSERASKPDRQPASQSVSQSVDRPAVCKLDTSPTCLVFCCTITNQHTLMILIMYTQS